MSDSYGDGWNGAEWAAPSFGQSLSLADGGYHGTKSFVVQLCTESETCKDKNPSWCERKLNGKTYQKFRKKCSTSRRVQAKCNKSCGNCNPYSCPLTPPPLVSLSLTLSAGSRPDSEAKNAKVKSKNRKLKPLGRPLAS